MRKHIKKDNFKELGIEAMLEKLLKYKGEIDSQSLLPSFLDPRYSDRMTGNSRTIVINLLKSMLQHTKGDRTQPKKQHSIFDMTEEENFAVAATVEYPELTRFINLQKINTDQDPLLWWSKHEAICPNLAEIARDQLAILASSVGFFRRRAGQKERKKERTRRDREGMEVSGREGGIFLGFCGLIPSKSKNKFFLQKRPSLIGYCEKTTK